MYQHLHQPMIVRLTTIDYHRHSCESCVYVFVFMFHFVVLTIVCSNSERLSRAIVMFLMGKHFIACFASAGCWRLEMHFAQILLTMRLNWNKKKSVFRSISSHTPLIILIKCEFFTLSSFEFYSILIYTSLKSMKINNY